MNIQITNCNNIDNGSVNLVEGRLNIKYAINGTGKSTLAKSIELRESPEQLKNLVPYKYLMENPVLADHQPVVGITPSINKVSIFNEETINQYTFLPDDLLANSFEILIKTEDYEIRMRKIQILIKEIQDAFKDNPDLDQLIAELSTFISGFGNAQNGYSKTGSIGKGLAKGNKVANVPAELVQYAPYIQSEMNASWLAWQSKGSPYLEVANKCPYCAENLEAEKKQVVQQVAVEYDSKYIAELQKMLGVFKALEKYFTETVKEKINKLSNSSISFSPEEINFLKEIKSQVVILYNKLFEIKNLNFETLKDVDAVVVSLNDKRIDLAMLGHINSTYSNERISVVNSALANVITQAGQLQGEINQQKNLIRKTIEKYHKEINGFLESAGYNYQISIIENQDKSTYRMVLLSKENTTQVNNVKLHLSYGERNAFALVLFMYRAIKENPDLVILDDPISSFDKNKKYAIMEMLFQGAGTLQGKTVLMLTHDFDPIVDLINTSSIRCRFNPIPVAAFLYNKEGTLHEKEISPSDILSFFEIANINIAGDIDEINKLIYLRRRLEACGEKGLAWQLLSNVFHPDRTIPLLQSTDGNRQMAEVEIAEATETIKKEIPEFEYNRVYCRAHDKVQMITLYNSVTSGYEKIQLYRLINHGQISDTIFKKFVDEAYHIESDSLFQLNPTEFPTIPEYIIKLCDNGIALLEEQI
ncbi:AAA family ATPase [Paenibacillus sp. D2_2]|uniref:AAA family ATPase n=1 Tax=Paenibacillus sp. D2_2 TaxID=3073092 RepID=UPI00281548EF|nr:AAA family ATPase [Paenibacillus sp. D2_2]WMT42284.1 AAA family ATPase [Paenibacillus sp. D2_2]